MQAGKFNKKIFVYRYQKVSDGFGGFNNSKNLLYELWAKIKHVNGDIEETFGRREIFRGLEVMIRKDPGFVDHSIHVGDVISLNNTGIDEFLYRINTITEVKNDNFMLIKATQNS